MGNWDQNQLGWNFNKCLAIAFDVYFKQGTRSTVSRIKVFLLTGQIMCNARNFPSAQSPALESLPRKDERIFFQALCLLHSHERLLYLVALTQTKNGFWINKATYIPWASGIFHYLQNHICKSSHSESTVYFQYNKMFINLYFHCANNV